MKKSPVRDIKSDAVGYTVIALLVIAFFIALITLPVWVPVLWLYKRWKYHNAPKSCCKSGCSPCPWGNLRNRKHRAKILKNIAEEEARGEFRLSAYQRCRTVFPCQSENKPGKNIHAVQSGNDQAPGPNQV